MANPPNTLTSDQHRDLAEVLTRWLPERRWFAGKSHTITALRVCEVTSLPSAVPLLHVVVGVQLDDALWQTYQVPLSLYSEPHAAMVPIGQLDSGAWAHDALADPSAVGDLLVASDGRAEVDPDTTHQSATSDGSHPSPTLQATTDAELYRRLPVRPLGVEQSNTSVVFGHVALVKFFRQLVPGINPDVEVHAALHVARCPNVGRILGWVNGGWRDPEHGVWVTGHLAMAQELLSPAVEGRDLALDRLRAGDSFTSEAEELGRATGTVHRDLRQVLPTHELSPAEVGELVDRLHWRLDQAVATVADLQPLAPALHDRIHALLTLQHPIQVQRVHGDLHLQQAMRTDAGWKILDFEGEPGSSMAARVAPDHALRDVAGMLRSFAYAAAQGGGDRPADDVALWLGDCQEAFLAGYSASLEAGDEHESIDPTILAAYLVDKAAYEAAYEQRNRPDWLHIPMTALVELAR